MFACYAALLFIKAARLALAPPERSLCFTADVFFFSFFQSEISELLRPIAPKLCRVIGSWSNIIFYVPKFKIRGVTKKRAQFGPISDNLRFRSRRYRQSENYLIDNDPSRVRLCRWRRQCYSFLCLPWEVRHVLYAQNFLVTIRKKSGTTLFYDLFL